VERAIREGDAVPEEVLQDYREAGRGRLVLPGPQWGEAIRQAPPRPRLPNVHSIKSGMTALERWGQESCQLVMIILVGRFRRPAGQARPSWRPYSDCLWGV
jgi:hypothetical protein